MVMKGSESVKKNGWLILGCCIICLAIGVTFGVFWTKSQEKNNNNSDSITTDTNTPSADKKEEEEKITCQDCQNSIDVDYMSLQQNDISAKILLDNKIRNLNISLESTNNSIGFEKITLDGKTIKEVYPVDSVKSVYVIDNSVLMLYIFGSDIRNDNFVFFDSNMKELKVDMTLDSNYPVSMVAGNSSGTNYVTVSENKIIITGTRKNHGPSIVNENNEAIEYCEGNTVKNDFLKSHNGEVISAQYEIDYLGNNQFSKAKKIKTLEIVTDTLCS